jgi:TfoX/Sxy family transcriptional regulator of competence genes
MPYNQQLAERLRQKLVPIVQVDEKKMFGGIAFMLNGNLLVGVIKDSIIVRVGPDGHADALKQPGARPFDLTGKPMSGWVMISEKGYDSETALERWIHLALEFVRTLPTK